MHRGWGKEGFHFSKAIPNAFPSNSKFPKMSPITFGQSCPLFTYIGGPKGKYFIFQAKLLFWAASSFFFFFFFFVVMDQSRWLIAKKKKKKKKKK